MTRRTAALSILFCVLLCRTNAGRAAADESKPRRPNIVLIVGDDMGYADLAVHGCKDIATPHLDALAAGGVRCTNGYVSGPYCSPTRAGLLTGRYQQRFGHEFNPGGAASRGDPGLPPSEVTIANLLQGAGYRTALVGKWHLGYAEKQHPLARGFDEFFGFLGGAHSYFPDRPRMQAPIFRGRDEVAEKEYLTDALAREAVAYIERNRERPFFLYLAFNAVHTPMHATDKYLARCEKIADPRRRAYAAMMSAMDDAVGRVMASLAEHKLDNDTLVAFISDNGGPPANASDNGHLRGRKAQTLEGGVRVPFFVRWKGRVPEGKTYDEPVIQLDLFSTALAAAGAAPPEKTKIDGVDLLPYLAAGAKGKPHARLYWRFGRQMAIREGNLKLVKWNAEPASLFDLAVDAGEQNDLAGARPDDVRRLQTAWNAWNAELAEPLWEPPARARQNRRRRAAQ